VDTVLTPATLEATKGLVRLVLQREREGHRDAPACRDQVPAPLQHQLDAVPREALLASIRRHRLACVMHGDPLVARLLPQLAPSIQALARQETMAALALASLTREMAALFEQAAIPMLVIKGIPLALQTTGSLTARGRGDLDLLVDPRQLPAAVALLESAGFSRCPGEFPRQLNNAWGHYSRWVGYQLSLLRQGPAGLQSIDLHWALSNMRAPLPSFALAWQSGEQLDLNGQLVITLSRTHAFQHACAHAAKDQWMCLRNLIDIDRLADQLLGRGLSRLRHQPMVCWSCAVTHAVTRNKALRPLNRGVASGSTKAQVRAAQAQALPWRSEGSGPWTPRRWATRLGRMLVMSPAPRDWLRIILFFTLPPAAGSDPETGEDRGLAGVLQARITRLRRLDEQPRV
jgi:hypothetical protein